MTSKAPETEDKVISEWGMPLEARIKQLNNHLKTRTCNQAYYDDMLRRAITTALEAAKREAERAAVNLVLRRLKSDYSQIRKPITDSPMELTEQAKNYNLFVDDLAKWIVREGKRWADRPNQPKQVGDHNDR